MFFIKPEEFEEMLKAYMEYFTNRWNKEPIMFVVHPTFDNRYKLPDGLKVVVQAKRYILPNNLWMIVDDE